MRYTYIFITPAESNNTDINSIRSEDPPYSWLKKKNN